MLMCQRADRMKTSVTESLSNWSHGPQPCLTQWNYEPCHVEFSSVTELSDFFWPHGLQHTRVPVHHQVLDLASITSHINNWMLYLLWLHLFILLGVISPLIPVAYWAPTIFGTSSFSVLSFCLFIKFMGFSRQEYRSCLPFPFPVYHILSELSSMTCPS